MKTQTAIDHFGDIHKLAAALELTVRRIYQFGDDVPYKLACRLQVMTKGELVVDAEEKDRRSKPGTGRNLTGAKSKAGGKKMAART